VVVADLLDGPGEGAVAGLHAADHPAVFVHLDATSADDNEAAAAAAIEHFGRLDVW